MCVCVSVCWLTASREARMNNSLSYMPSLNFSGTPSQAGAANSTKLGSANEPISGGVDLRTHPSGIVPVLQYVCPHNKAVDVCMLMWRPF